jgi:hypothetical protein
LVVAAVVVVVVVVVVAVEPQPQPKSLLWIKAACCVIWNSFYHPNTFFSFMLGLNVELASLE